MFKTFLLERHMESITAVKLDPNTMLLLCEYKNLWCKFVEIKNAEVMSTFALLVGGYCCIIHLNPARTRACAPRVALPLRLGRGVCGLASRVLCECQLGVVRAGLVRRDAVEMRLKSRGRKKQLGWLRSNTLH